MFTMRAATIAISLVASTARLASAEREVEPRPQLQADLGLSVICAGYEHPLTRQVALFAGAGIFGSYFLPWFDRGDNTRGPIGDLRVTWFPRSEEGRGLYVTPYVRAGYASGENEDTGASGGGAVVTAGAFVGYAFWLSSRLDLRLGAGGQYIYVNGKNGVGASTPFVALDIALGVRL